uniref:Uncharacterized protein n=1 Tax=Aplanochytrium stocchinoi TaxID=215587 RepID=A0A7S3V2Q8_9STRA
MIVLHQKGIIPRVIASILRSGRSQSEVDKRLLETCECKQCREQFEKLNSGEEGFLVAWSKDTARKAKEQMLAKTTKLRKLHDELKQTVTFTRDVVSQPRTHKRDVVVPKLSRTDFHQLYPIKSEYQVKAEYPVKAVMDAHSINIDDVKQIFKLADLRRESIQYPVKSVMSRSIYDVGPYPYPAEENSNDLDQSLLDFPLDLFVDSSASEDLAIDLINLKY